VSSKTKLRWPRHTPNHTLITYLSTGGTTAARPGMVEVAGRFALISAAMSGWSDGWRTGVLSGCGGVPTRSR
jgi:hypothetical protein